MKHMLTMIVRVLFGVFLLVMGLNGFFQFMALPPMGLEGTNFILALAHTGYMLPFIDGLLVVVGVMLVFNIFVPLALLLIAPFVLQSFLFHVYLEPGMLVLAVVVLIVELFLALMYWDNYAHLFKKK